MYKGLKQESAIFDIERASEIKDKLQHIDNIDNSLQLTINGRPATCTSCVQHPHITGLFTLWFPVSSSFHPSCPSTGFASAVAAQRPSLAEVRSQRNAVFSREQARQRALYPRIEKIEVSMQGPGLDGALLVMNKGMSTPLSCARRE